MRHNKKLTHLAQQLRKNMTKEERKLWYEFLQQYPCRFHRQVTVGGYILDFYCSKARLAVELDGSQHYEPENQAKEKERTSYLEKNGIRVLRFQNTEVIQKFRDVCDIIHNEVENFISKNNHQK